MCAARDGSVDFWLLKLRGVLDEDDISDAASKLAAAKFKQRHIDTGKLSEEVLRKAGLEQAVIMDVMEHLSQLSNINFRSGCCSSV